MNNTSSKEEKETLLHNSKTVYVWGIISTVLLGILTIVFISICVKFIPMFTKTVDHWDPKTNTTTRKMEFASEYHDERIISGILAIIIPIFFFSILWFIGVARLNRSIKIANFKRTKLFVKLSIIFGCLGIIFSILIIPAIVFAWLVSIRSIIQYSSIKNKLKQEAQSTETKENEQEEQNQETNKEPENE